MPRTLLLFLLACPLLAGCERPFVEATAPTLELIEPDSLDTVRTESRLPLAFRASSFRAISRVEINGEAATYLTDEDVYLDTLQLQIGLNLIRVDAFDSEGTTGTDTLYAVHLPYAWAGVSLTLPSPLGGHAATPLADGTVLFTGGAPSANAPASDEAFVFDPATFTVAPLDARLNTARAGHTASLLPDGRVLILGGSTVATPESRSDLVEAIEVFDPTARTFTVLPLVDMDDSPAGASLTIQRTEHTTTVVENAQGEAFAYLYGGLGPRFNGSEVVPNEFMRTLRVEQDRVVAIGPRERFRFATVAGHTQTPLADVGSDGFGRYLVAGASLPDGTEPAAPFVFTFEPQFLDVTDTLTALAPRTDHAAARLDELVLVAGGRDPETQSVLPSVEVFAPETGRSFVFPDALRPDETRWGHTATNIGLGRILLVGGFSPSGSALNRTELFFPR